MATENKRQETIVSINNALAEFLVHQDSEAVVNDLYNRALELTFSPLVSDLLEMARALDQKHGHMEQADSARECVWDVVLHQIFAELVRLYHPIIIHGKKYSLVLNFNDETDQFHIQHSNGGESMLSVGETQVLFTTVMLALGKEI